MRYFLKETDDNCGCNGSNIDIKILEMAIFIFRN